MDLLRRSIGRFGPMFLVISMLGALLSGPSVATSQVVPESVLAKNVNEPIGVAASPGRLLVTHPFCGNPREVLSISGTGKVSVLATLPNRPAVEGNPGACFEDYLTIVPAPSGTNPEDIAGFPTPNNGFRSNDIFVTQGQNILKVAFDGSSVSLFKTLSTCPTTQSGITFDNVVGNQLVVVCANGQVYTLNSAGTATLRGTITATGPFEGPVVSPFTANVSPGCLLVAADHASAGEGQPNGKVFTFCNLGGDPVAAPIAVPFAEGVTIVPSTKCTFALTPGDTYFTAIFGVGGNTIDQLPQSAFAGLGGDALVPSESNSGGESPPGITLISPGTEGLTTTTFRPFFAQHQGSAFVDCHVPVLVRIQVIRQGATLTLQIFGADNFDPALIIVPSLRFGPTGTEKPGNLNCVLPQKDDQESPTGAEHEHKGVATCTMDNNLGAGQPGIYKAKFTDPANPGGDGDSEGGGGG